VHLGEGSRVLMKPDVVELKGNQPVAVFDAKYELEDSASGYRMRMSIRPTAPRCN
jgi:hypothetical protein